MRLLFKLLGLLLILIVSAAIGFLKAYKLKLRAQKLYCMLKSVTRLKELINLQGGEIDLLIAQSFEEYPINFYPLEADERKIIDTLLFEVGMLDSQSACKRCELCITLLNTKYTEAEQQHHSLGKLYRSVGLLLGIFICIFLI